ncbi:MAG: hypothetical protein ACKO90_40645, partial [Microcystis panniformis]
WLGQQQKITCDLPRLSGEVKLKVEFAKPKIIAPSDEKLSDSTIGKMKLYIITSNKMSILSELSQIILLTS